MMENKFNAKKLWLGMFIFAIILFLVSSFIGILRGFDYIGTYMILSSMLLVIFCDSNLNREVLIETMMRISVFDLLTNPKKKTLIEKMMMKDKTFQEYMDKKTKGGKLEDK